MADIAGLEPAFCGFKSRAPYHSPALVPSGPPALAVMPPRGPAELGPTANRQPLTATTFVYLFQALSSAGESGLFIRARSRVRIPQGQPI